MTMPSRFWLLFAGRTISVLGNAFGPVAVAFGVLALPGATAATLAVVLAAQGVPQLALLLLGGVIGDRYSRYRVLVAAELLAAAAFAGLAAMLLTGWAPLAAMAGCAFVAGSASALLFPSLTGTVTQVVPRESLQQANAHLRLGTNAARIAGMVAAGVTVAWLGPGVALALDAATYLVAAGLLAALRLPSAVRTPNRGVGKDLRTGWREFSRRQWMWSVVGAAAFINVASAVGFTMLGPVIARDRLGGPVAWSVVLTAYAIGMMAGVAVAMRFKPRRPLVAALLVTPLLAMPLFALGTAVPLPVVAAAAFCSGVAMDVFGVLWDTTVQREVPTEALARVSSYEYLVAFSLKPVGVLAAGQLAAYTDAGATLLVFGIVVVAAGAAALASPAVRAVTAEPPAAEPPATETSTPVAPGANP